MNHPRSPVDVDRHRSPVALVAMAVIVCTLGVVIWRLSALAVRSADREAELDAWAYGEISSQ